MNDIEQVIANLVDRAIRNQSRPELSNPTAATQLRPGSYPSINNYFGSKREAIIEVFQSEMTPPAPAAHYTMQDTIKHGKRMGPIRS